MKVAIIQGSSQKDKNSLVRDKKSHRQINKKSP